LLKTVVLSAINWTTQDILLKISFLCQEDLALAQNFIRNFYVNEKK